MKSTTTFDSGTELEVTLCIAKENGTIFLGTSGDQDELTIHGGQYKIVNMNHKNENTKSEIIGKEVKGTKTDLIQRIKGCSLAGN